ncbi:MAG: alpha/beta hydrolase [Gammaproteobacteria bacterium]|jgi:hypothetical protein|nr:alpha/beta hydrolase [Gammaproteobacteria bacterium]
MKRITFRLFLVLGVAAVLLLGVGAYLYFVGTRTLLEHAEALRFSRIQAPRLADTDTLRLFYASNRAPMPSAADAAPDRRFTSARGDALELGSFDIAVEPTLGLGILLNASDWLINEEIQLEAVRPLPRPAFSGELREQVLASSYRSLLVVVHGYRETFPSALRKTAFLTHVLDIDTPVLLFDWPGDQGASLAGYRRARRVATASAEELMQPADRRLTLVDVTPVNRTRNFHNFGLETPEFFDDLFLRLTSRKLPASRRLYFVETADGRRYFVLTRGL